jgi:hypothetical protein
VQVLNHIEWSSCYCISLLRKVGSCGRQLFFLGICCFHFLFFCLRLSQKFPQNHRLLSGKLHGVTPCRTADFLVTIQWSRCHKLGYIVQIISWTSYSHHNHEWMNTLIHNCIFNLVLNIMCIKYNLCWDLLHLCHCLYSECVEWWAGSIHNESNYSSTVKPV